MQQGITVESARSQGGAAGRGRTLTTYLAILTADALIASVVMGLRRGSDAVLNLARGMEFFVASGAGLVPILAVGMIPGVVLSMAVAARWPGSSLGRALAGAFGWGAWTVGLILANAITSAQSPFAPPVYLAWSVLAISGGVFAAVGLRADARPAGRALTALAVAIVGSVLLFTVVFAGRLLGPA